MFKIYKKIYTKSIHIHKYEIYIYICHDLYKYL